MENPASKDQGLRSVLVQALGLRELSHAALGQILLLCLVIPVAHALRLGPLWPSAFGFALVILVARAPLASSRRTALIAIGVCFALHLTAQLLSIENHFVEPESDFRTQWETAIDYVNWGVQVPDRPQTQRALPFYYPLVWLFGSSSTVYLAANVVLTSSTYLMSVWIARRYFGWAAAAKTAVMLLFGFEVLFAIKFPSHDVLNSFGFLLFLVLLVETEVIVDRQAARWSRSRIAAVTALAVAMSLTITWLDWQRGTGTFCMAAILFYGVAGFVRRLARWKLRSGIAVGVCVVSVLQTAGLSSCGLVAPTNPTGLNSTEMIVLTMGTEEGDGRYGDWYRSARMATELEPDAVARLGPMLFAETLRTNAGGKYEVYLKRQLNFLRTGQDTAWYLTVKDPRWLSQEDVTSLYATLAKWTPPIWWAIALLLGIAALRRDVLFDVRFAPVILVGAFMAIMGCFAETQSRHSMFLVFLWPIYAGSPFVANPLARAAGAPITRRTMARVAITLAAVIGIPLVIKQLIPRAPLANFAKARIDIGTSEWATEPVGAPPETIALRNLLHVSDFEMSGCPEAPACRPGAQSFGRTVTATAKIFGEDDQNTLRFVLYNEIGGAFDELLPRPERFGTLPRRALRVFVDDRLVKTLDLAMPFTPRVIEISGFEKGPHFVRLVLDLGEAGHVPRTAGKTCYHFWSAPMRCVGTTIAYLGFY